MHITSNFDSGNIEVVATEPPSRARLRIRPDAHAGTMQWFHFRVTGVAGQPCELTILNAGEASYPKGFEDYRAVASYDRQHWFRVPTAYDGTELRITHTPACDAVYYAAFAPYPLERHRDLVARMQAQPGVALEVLGTTAQGQPLEVLRVGEPGPDRRACWFVCRQHPGESMAEWWAEGLLERLTDTDDTLAQTLRERAVIYVVPNMNPEGTELGHLRVNAAGANLNRCWNLPEAEAPPEVALVRAHMARTGVDFCLDVHGDEGLPYAFAVGCDGIPSLDERQAALLDTFRDGLAAATPDFQTAHGYGKAPAGKANLALCTNYVAETFGCVALTLEQPFKDNADLPDADHGWSPARCKGLAAATLRTLHAMAPRLR